VDVNNTSNNKRLPSDLLLSLDREHDVYFLPVVVNNNNTSNNKRPPRLPSDLLFVKQQQQARCQGKRSFILFYWYHAQILDSGSAASGALSAHQAVFV